MRLSSYGISFVLSTLAIKRLLSLSVLSSPQIGKRVYWPGSGLDIVEYDLLEVGDDVVFGSRSVIMTSSAGRSAPVVFEAGSMVADRCVILPGVTVRKGGILGA
jgi:acetyltransferase-like isoleucine patch superfamily enzyme